MIPDFATIAASGDRRVIVSVPLAVRLGTVDLGSSVRIGFTPFCEAQYGHDAIRGILGERTVFGSPASRRRMRRLRTAR